MELLSHFGVSCELLKDEFVRRLRLGEYSEQQVHGLRLALFEDAVKKILADSGDVLVKRKKTSAGKSVKEKHIDDIWCLAGAIKRCELVPRDLLRNGKRGNEELLNSQAVTRRKREADGASDRAQGSVSDVHSNGSMDCDVLAEVSNAALTTSEGFGMTSGNPLGIQSEYPSVHSSQNPLENPSDHLSQNPSVNPAGVFQAKMIESINLLREDVETLRSEVMGLKTTTPTTMTTTQIKYCSLYVRLDGRWSDNHIGKCLLESLLECTVSQYTRLMGTRSPSFKVKVSESDAQSAVAAGAKSGCFVARWSNSRNNSSPASLRPSCLPVTKKPSK